MREFLDDAHAHRDDGYGRAQAHAKRELPKRFYKAATVQPLEGGYAVGLDGRVPRTPGMKHVVVPSEALAQEMAREQRPERLRRPDADAGGERYLRGLCRDADAGVTAGPWRPQRLGLPR